MKADINETVAYSAEAAAKAELEEAQPILQVKRPLLPIDEYAAREGVTRSIVEKCGRLGIIQIRKYKGHTYVVDVPLSPYYHLSQETPILQESHKMTTQTTQKPRSASGQPVNKNTQSPKISELTQKVAADIHKIAGQPAKPKIEPPKAETMPEPAQSMFCEASKFKKQLIEKIKHETGAKPSTGSNPPSAGFSSPDVASGLRSRYGGAGDYAKAGHPETTSKPAQISQGGRSEFDILTEQVLTKRAWQVGAVSLIVCLCAALLTGLWLYTNQRVHHSRLNRLSANIQNVYDDSVRTGQQLATFQSKLIESTAEFEWIKSEMESTKVRTESAQEDIKSLRHEITKVREGLETLQQHNTAALEQLKEQFQQLTVQLSEFTQNSRTAPGSRDSSK